MTGRLSTSSILAAVGATLLALLVATSGSAPAQSGALPASTCGIVFKDAAGDNNSLTGDTDDEDVNLDIIEGFFAHDAAKGDKATTANLRVTDMSTRMHSGGTGVVWNFGYNIDAETTKFVRVLVDFSGGPYYEHGTVIPESNTNPVARYQYEGATEGTLVEGPNGGFSIVIPQSVAAPGTKLTEPFGSSNTSRQAIPGSIPSPTRGLSNGVDQAPDDSGPGNGGTDWTVGPCAAGGTDTGGGTGTTPGTGTGSKTGTGTTPPPDAGNPSLPVKLLSKSKKAVKKGKALPLKLKASEPISNLGARLTKGKSVYGTGKLAKLSGPGTLKLKVTKKLTKGSYVLDLAGNDAKGARRLVSLKFSAK